MSVWSKHHIGPKLFVRFGVQCNDLMMLSHCWLGGRKGIRSVKNGGWWRWALLSPDGVAPSRVVSESACVNLPLHHKVQKFSSVTGWPRWSWKRP